MGRGRRTQERPPGRPLSRMEKTVLEALAAECTIEEIGRRMGMRYGLVVMLIESICDKAFPTSPNLRGAICAKLLS